jgi:uncharacterized protein (TIGR03083 family)
VTELNAEHARRAIVEHTRRLAESAAAAGPDAAVPTTPKWTITDLVEHVGQTQHWVAEIIEGRITDPMPLPTQMAVLPADPREWQAWLSESAQRVASACSDDALDAPVFNPAGDERPGARFWMSSLLNEAVVHGFDAASAFLRAPPGRGRRLLGILRGARKPRPALWGGTGNQLRDPRVPATTTDLKRIFS